MPGSGVKVGELYGELRLDKSRFDRGLDQSGVKFGGLAKIVAIGAGAIVGSLALVGGAALNTGINFEKGMANVQTLIGSGSAAEARIEEFKGSVKDLSISTGVSLDNMTDGLYQVISAWGDSADASKQLEISAKAAKAGLATTTDAVNLLSTVTKGYGDTSAYAVQHAADLAFQTANLGQTTFPELAQSMGKVIPLAATMGVKQEELFGAMATLTGVTGDTSEVTTQLKAVMTALINANPKMVAALKAQGFESGRAAIKSLGLSGTLDMLKDAAGGSDLKLAQMVGSSEALNAILALTGNQASDFTKKTEAMYKASGKNAKAFADLEAGIADTTARIKSGKAAPSEYADVINEFKNNLGLTDAQIKVFLSDLESMGETKALEKLKKGVQDVTGASETAFNIQQKTVSATMERIGASIQVLLVDLGEKLLPAFADILDWVLANMPAIQATIEGVFSAVGEAFNFIANDIIPVFAAAFQFIVDNVMPLFQTAADGVAQDVLPALGAAFDFISTTVLPALAAVFQWISTNIMPSVQAVFQVFIDTILPVLAAAFNAVVSVVRDNWPAISSIAMSVGAVVKTAVEIISAVITAVMPVIKNLAQVVFPILSTAAGVLLTALSTVFTAIEAVFTAFANAGAFAVSGAKVVWSSLTGFFSSLWNGITGIIKGAVNAIIGLINGMIDAINSFQIHFGGLDLPGLGRVAAVDWNGLNIGHVPYLAKGALNFPGGLAMLGENGPELARLPAGTDVFSNSATQDILNGMGASDAPQEVHYHYYLTVEGDLQAKDPPSVLSVIKRMQDISDPGQPGLVAEVAGG